MPSARNLNPVSRETGIDAEYLPEEDRVVQMQFGSGGSRAGRPGHG
jgi:hypothetical protein